MNSSDELRKMKLIDVEGKRSEKSEMFDESMAFEIDNELINVIAEKYTKSHDAKDTVYLGKQKFKVMIEPIKKASKKIKLAIFLIFDKAKNMRFIKFVKDEIIKMLIIALAIKSNIYGEFSSETKKMLNKNLEIASKIINYMEKIFEYDEFFKEIKIKSMSSVILN